MCEKWCNVEINEIIVIMNKWKMIILMKNDNEMIVMKMK